MNDATSSTVTGTRAAVRPGVLTLGRLVVVSPRALAWSCTLRDDPRVIGRAAANEAGWLNDDTVSREHLEVRWDAAAGAHVCRDLDSHNGTRLDGAPLGREWAPLADQSVLILGDVILIYEQADVSATTEAAIPELAGESAAIRRLRAELSRTATDRATVLLVGETGTGKEYASRAIHALSGRSGPLVSINCAALSAQLVESQLFGHVRGAFTGATGDSPGVFREANGGTLLLDEIGELPLELQAKLLRVLESGEVQPVGGSRTVHVDVRLVAATNRSLDLAVDAGEFRRDLYARLARRELRVPPLRERRVDLLQWFDRLWHCWWQQRGETTAALPSFDPEAAEYLLLRRWDNNLRELDRLVHTFAGDASLHGTVIGVDHLPDWMRRGSAGTAAQVEGSAPREPVPRVPTREEFIEAYHQLGGSARALARHFARDRRQIYRWLDAYGLR